MVKKAIITGLFLVFVTMSSLAFAADVFVTKNGKKFHAQTCQLVKNRETTKMDDQEAIKNGYSPCSKCHKENKEKK